MYNKAMRLFSLFLLLVLVSFQLRADLASPFLCGRDVSWQGISLSNRENQVNAFLDELIAEISFSQKTEMQIQENSPHTLFKDLKEGKKHAVFSSIALTDESKAIFDFSSPILFLGPVLIVRKEDRYNSLKDLEGKKVAVSTADKTFLKVQKKEAVQFKHYDDLHLALQDLSSGKVEAALLPTFQAHTIVPQRFPYSLRIASAPLTEDAIRLVTLKGQEKKLLTLFNKGLKKLKKAGIYNWLRLQYGVY